jgi:hypothetical protein
MVTLQSKVKEITEDSLYIAKVNRYLAEPLKNQTETIWREHSQRVVSMLHKELKETKLLTWKLAKNSRRPFKKRVAIWKQFKMSSFFLGSKKWPLETWCSILQPLECYRSHPVLPGTVAHACNPRYSGGRDWEDLSSRPAQAKRSWDPYHNRSVDIVVHLLPQLCRETQIRKIEVHK